MDTLFYNGCIHTLNLSMPIAQAVGIDKGKIVFVGTDQEAEKLDWEKRIDLQGRLLLPGFVDAHLHMLHYAFVERSVKLFDCTSAEDAIERARLRLTENSAVAPSWLFCRGFNEEHFDVPRYPTRQELDALSESIPIIMVRVCGHIAVANSCGLKKLKAIPQFDDISQDVDFETGILRENAVQFFYSILDAPSQEEVEAFILFGLSKLNEKGITGIQSDDLASLPGKNWRRILSAFKSLDEKGALNARVYEQCLFERFDDLKVFIQEGYRTGQKGDHFTIGPVKLLQDGSLGARTAALTKPYEQDPDNTGIIIYEQDELDAIVRFCDAHQMQLAVHCIGDRAMEMVIRAVEHSDCRKNNPKGRHGIVHTQITSPSILKGMQKNHLIAYIQPVFIDLDMDIVESRVGKERMATSYAWKSMRNMGIPTAGGSDAPVVSFDIMENIYFAVTRKNINGVPDGGWLPDEKLTVDEAVRLFTIDAAYASYSETENGSIEIGKNADLVVFDQDIYSIEPDTIKDVRILRTVVGGKTVYEA